MNAQAFTPGPWKAGPVYGSTGRAVFWTDTSKPGKWQRRLDLDRDGVFSTDDASRIAAALELYEALQMFMALDSSFSDATDGEIEAIIAEGGEAKKVAVAVKAARAALAKAVQS